MSTSTIDPNNVDPSLGADVLMANIKTEFANAKFDLEFHTTIDVGSGHTSSSGVLWSITGGAGNTNNGSHNHIGGGSLNAINGAGSFIGCGLSNVINSPSNYAAICSGWGNILNSCEQSAILGGRDNNVDGDYSAILGGQNCSVKLDYAYAGGRRSISGLSGQFTFSDSSNFDWSNTVDTTHTWATNQVNLRYAGGYYFASAINGFGVPTAGVQCVTGANAWATLSDKNKKQNFKALNHIGTVDILRNIDVTGWQYKSDVGSKKNYYGWMAQDFHKAFKFGGDPLSIDTQQNIGVLTSAVKGLIELVDELKEEIKILKSQ